VQDGIIQAHYPLHVNHFSSTYISRELVQQFVQLISSTANAYFLSIILEYLDKLMIDDTGKARWLFSLTLNRSLLHIMCCGGNFVTDLAVESYFTLLGKLLPEQNRQVADSGAWPVLIGLLSSGNKTIAKSAADAMQHLVRHRNGEDYARFVEEGLFEDVMKAFGPSPEPFTVEIPFAPDAECSSAEFTALGWTWCALFVLPSLPIHRLLL
jgi:hypothetical protein